MSFKQWLVLLLLYLVFMVAGAVMFLYLEAWYEDLEMASLENLKLHAREVVTELRNESRGKVEVLLWEIGEECGHDFLIMKEDAPRTWTLWNSFYFTFTVITTIGFGHMAPKTPWGRIACILYAFIGVPLNGILVASLADIFSTRVRNWDVRQWASRYKSWFTVLVDSVVFLVPGLVVFLIIPSLVLMAVEEDWTYLDAFYFAFITLTTIGFGDHVAGQQERDHVWVWVYKIVMVAWIIFGLGYIIMIITFVQKALKSKRILLLEKKMAKSLKKHVTRVHTDLGAVRRAINTNNRVGPEDITTSKKGDPASPELRHQIARSQSEPCGPLSLASRPRSASESDLSMPHNSHRHELEGMNAMLDFIERLLHYEETRALTSMNRLLYHHEHCRDNLADEDDDENGGFGGDDVEGGCDNCGFEADAGDLTVLRSLAGRREDIEEVGKVLTPRRKISNAEETLYMMLMARGKARHTPSTTIISSTTQPPPPHSPPPSYNSIPHPIDDPAHHHHHHHTLTLLTNFFQRQRRGGHSSFPSSTAIPRPSSHLSSSHSTPQLPLVSPIPPFHPRPRPKGEEKEFTKL